MKSKTYKVLIAVSVSVMMAGCTANEYMDDITAHQAGQEKVVPSESGDDVTKALTAAGFGDVRLETLSYQYDVDDESTHETRYYFFTLEQPVSHHDKSLGTYKQRACLRMKDPTAPVLLYTHGYHMDESAKYVGINDVAIYMDEVSGKETSELHVEHRYFGKSLPETYESLAFTYLNADEAAHDLDSMLVRLQRTVLAQSDKWISMGLSKDGITTGLLAYYADQYGWNQKDSKGYFRMDLYMPLCAPFLEGTPESCDDPKMGYYLYQNSGSGYAEGSTEEKAYRQLKKIPEAIVTNKSLREACLKMLHVIAPATYLDVVNKYGTDEEKVSAALLQVYMNNLFGKFSYIPYQEWAHLVPDVEKAIMEPQTDEEADAKEEAMQKLTEFVFMNDEALDYKLTMEALTGYTYTNGQQPLQLTDDIILEKLRTENAFPYYIQAVKELGNIRYDFTMLEGVKFSPTATQDMGYWGKTIAQQFEISTQLAKYADQWDGGKLMKSYRNWAVNSCTANMAYIYGENDPWTGGAIDVPQISNVKRYIFKNTVHTYHILSPRYYPTDDADVIKGVIDGVLKNH